VSAIHARSGRWLVLVDVAKHAATAPLELSQLGADFAVLSFYKICGWPDALGALIIRRGA
jgi:molybdenum cofactor sulfurtransferase